MRIGHQEYSESYLFFLRDECLALINKVYRKMEKITNKTVEVNIAFQTVKHCVSFLNDLSGMMTAYLMFKEKDVCKDQVTLYCDSFIVIKNIIEYNYKFIVRENYGFINTQNKEGKNEQR